MSKFKGLLTAMVQKQASDLFLTPGTPVILKVNGTCVPVNNQLLPSHGPLSLLSEVVSEDDIVRLKAQGELNTAVQFEEVGNFRISALRQKGSYSVVVRAIPSDIPALESLKLPAALANLVMVQRGLILVVGATGSGKRK